MKKVTIILIAVGSAVLIAGLSTLIYFMTKKDSPTVEPVAEVVPVVQDVPLTREVIDVGIDTAVTTSATVEYIQKFNKEPEFTITSRFRSRESVPLTTSEVTPSGFKLTLNMDEFDTGAKVFTEGYVGGNSDVVLIGGRPACMNSDVAQGQLRYSRATDATGITWSTPVLVDTTGLSFSSVSMAVVGGLPAAMVVDYADNLEMYYLKATDEDWSASQAVITTTSAFTLGRFSLFNTSVGPSVIAFDADAGRVVVMGMNPGVVFASVTAITTGTVSTSSPVEIWMDSDGIFHVVVCEDGDLVYYKSTDDTGETFGAKSVVSDTCDTGTTDIKSYLGRIIISNGSRLFHLSTEGAWIKTEMKDGTRYSNLSVSTEGGVETLNVFGNIRLEETDELYSYSTVDELNSGEKNYITLVTGRYTDVKHAAPTSQGRTGIAFSIPADLEDPTNSGQEMHYSVDTTFDNVVSVTVDVTPT